MRKFIIKTLLIVLPFFVSFGCAVFFGAQNKGDLLRMGYLYDNTGDYGDRLIKNHRVDRKYSIVSNLDTTQKTKFKIFTIGDSFSQQDEYGYQNFLAREGVSVLHYFKRGNPIENLYSTLNGDFFEKVSPEYVVLQCVQRQALFRGTHSSSNKVLSVEQMTAFEKQVIENNSSSTKIKLFTDAVIKFPFYNVFHTVSDNAFFSKVYKVGTDRSMFSLEGSTDLLFTDEEIINLKHSEDLNSFDSLNNHLNTLSRLLEKKGIKLITLISPDKYDVHYNHILDKDSYPKPLFFNRFNKLSKNYQNIESKRLLQDATENAQDVYFYDDTHWSPIASKIIAEEIFKIVSEK